MTNLADGDLAFFADSWASLTISLRRSSVRGGMGRRMRSPSTCGFRPRSLSRMAFSTILTAALVPRLDGDHARLGDADRGHLAYRGRHAVVVDAKQSSMPACARPVRTLPRSRFNASCALPIEVFRSLRISSSMSGFSLKPQEPRLFASREHTSGAHVPEPAGSLLRRRRSLAPGEPFSTTVSPGRAEGEARKQCFCTNVLAMSGRPWVASMIELDFTRFPILVVDDEQDNLDAFRFVFRKVVRADVRPGGRAGPVAPGTSIRRSSSPISACPA